jgi:thymidylate synthase (FAD)
MHRTITPEAEALIGVKLPVLDKGHVILLDVMGGDGAVCAAARTSYAGGTKTKREDRGLINYLMENDHSSPFEMVELKFHIKLPLFAFAQFVRHRTASLNATSARYSEMPDEFYIPDAKGWREQSAANKQAGGEALSEYMGTAITNLINRESTDAYKTYKSLIFRSVAREQARMVLPQNLYTEIVWKCDLRNLLGFLRLRLDWHAQKEIRVYAEAMAECVKAAAPMCYEAWEEHVRYAVKLSRSEAAEKGVA